MTPKSKLFIGILAFMLIVNLLVIFDLNYFYIRAILSFIFLITIPGLLIMLCLKIRNINPWEYLVYVVGLSVAFIMFAGLAVNWILPWLNITDKPLSLWPILICFDIFLLILMSIASKRNKDLKFQPKFPKFSWLDRIFIIIPMLFPVLSILGAFLLNNHGTNIVTMIMLGAIAVYVLLVVIFRDKLNENVYLWALWMIGLSLLLMYSMRSWNISGMDSNQEFMISQIVKNNSFWDINSLTNLSYTNYEFMLSITIMPNLFFIFLNVSDYLIIKLFLQFLFSFVPLIIYIFSYKNFNKVFSLLASFFFISQPMFLNGSLSISPRQEIAFLFFGLMLLVLFGKEIRPKIKNLLFVIFGFSMIVSHYSTSYIALAIFLLTYILTLIYKLYENHKIKKGKLNPDEKSEFHLTGIILLLLFIFGFLWYSQVTPTGNGLIDFAHKSFSNLGNMFSEDVQIDSQSIFKQLNIFQQSDSQSLTIEDYAEKIIEDYKEGHPYTNFYDQQTYQDYKIQPKISSGLKNRFEADIVSKVYSLREIFKFLGNILISTGVISFLILQYKRKEASIEYVLIVLTSFFILISILVLPFISIRYDTGRTYQQMLFILSPMVLFGTAFLFKEKKRIIFISIFIIFYLLFLSRGAQQIVGGNDISMNFNNVGFEYDALYTHKAEAYSGDWLFQNYNKKNIIYADRFAYDKLLLQIPSGAVTVVKNIFPQTIRKGDYVYLSYNNLINNIAFRAYVRIMLSYDYPTEFLNDNKNKIYNNGGSEIFK